MCEFIKINVKDDVVVLLDDSKMGDTIKVDDKAIQILQDTPKGHKIAIKNIDKDIKKIIYILPIITLFIWFPITYIMSMIVL